MDVLLFLLGLLLYVVGAIGILVEEFKENILWGIFGLLFQIPNLLFACLYFQRCKRWLGCMLAGILICFLVMLI